MNLTKNTAIASIFYERYYLVLLKDIFEVLTDGYHKSGFKMQCKILYLMFQVTTSNYVRIWCYVDFIKDRRDDTDLI